MPGVYTYNASNMDIWTVDKDRATSNPYEQNTLLDLVHICMQWHKGGAFVLQSTHKAVIMVIV